MCLGAPWMSGLTVLICGENDKLFGLVNEGDEEAAATSIEQHHKHCGCRPKIKSAADPSLLDA